MDKQKGFYSPVRKILLMVLAAGLVGCLAFGKIYRASHAGWACSAWAASAMVVYHMSIRFLAPAVLWVLLRKTYDYRCSWFQPRPWEPRLYRLLRVKQWKARAITYDPREFSFQLHSLEEIINNMCHAEAVHELTAVFSLLSMFFAIPLGSAAALFVTAILAAALDLSSVVIQRYNRPRLVKILERKRAAA